jgi:serine phosphatase RsbU (regulator of sigma subunit)
VIEALQQKGEYGEQKDGMDIALCSIDFEKMLLQFSGANNPLCLVRKNDIEMTGENRRFDFEDRIMYEIKGDRMPIGIHYKMDNFTMHEVRLHPGDVIYIFSDGFPDQFGGPDGEKFKSRPFKELLLQNSQKSMEEQKIILEKNLEEWIEGYEQIDDILVIGFRIR